MLAGFLLAFAVAFLGACAEVEEMPLDAGTDRPTVVHLDARLQLDADECWRDPFYSVTFGYRQADMLILFDRSASMDTAFESGTRYQAVAAALSKIVQSYAARIRFGFQEMPGRQGCSDALNTSCCVSPPVVPVAEANAAAVVDALTSALPMEGSTPTAGALHAAYDYYQSLDDNVSNRYLLLVTDGVPSCDISGALAGSTSSATLSVACAGALAEVDALVGTGVRVLVLGLGQELVPDGSIACLDALARGGGLAASPGSPAFFAADDVAELRAVMARTFGGAVDQSCDLSPPQLPEDTKGMRVLFDGQAVQGWHAKPGQKGTIEIPEPACTRLLRFEVSTIQLQMPCTVSST